MNLIYFEDNIDTKISIFHNNIIELFDFHAPIKTFTIKKNSYAPGITDNIKLMQKLRDKALKKYKQTSAPDHRTYYKQLRNLTNSAIKMEKKAYLRFQFQNSNVKDKMERT